MKAFQLAYALAMDVFRASQGFPREERYSLTDQIRRSSRSVAANLAEGYRKRNYEKLFVLKLVEVDGEVAETQVWLDMAHDCGYIEDAVHADLSLRATEVGRLVGWMIRHPERFKPVAE